MLVSLRKSAEHRRSARACRAQETWAASQKALDADQRGSTRIFFALVRVIRVQALFAAVSRKIGRLDGQTDEFFYLFGRPVGKMPTLRHFPARAPTPRCAKL